MKLYEVTYGWDFGYGDRDETVCRFFDRQAAVACYDKHKGKGDDSTFCQAQVFVEGPDKCLVKVAGVCSWGNDACGDPYCEACETARADKAPDFPEA